MFKDIIAFLKDEDGQTSTEYILLVAVVVMVLWKFKRTFTEQIEKITGGVFSQMGSFVDQTSME